MCFVLAAFKPFTLALKLLTADAALIVFNGNQSSYRNHLVRVGYAVKLIQLLHKLW